MAQPDARHFSVPATHDITSGKPVIQGAANWTILLLPELIRL